MFALGSRQWHDAPRIHQLRHVPLDMVKRTKATARSAVSVADAVGVSPRQLRRKIRDLTGLSPSGFVRTLRLQRAAQLLDRKTGTISEISYEVGYDDAKHFSQLFREVYGVLPSEYGGQK